MTANNAILTTWGAAGSGKTTLAINLALALAESDYMIGIISSKLYYGELQNHFKTRVEPEQGIYKALQNGNTKNMFVQAGNKSSVFFLSPPNDFNAMLMSAVSLDSAKDMIEDAAMRFDYLIIDGSEELNNPISSIGLVLASQILMVHYPSVKDYTWYQGMSNMMDILRLRDKSVHILNGYDKSCDKAAFMLSLGVEFKYDLDYVENAKIYENSGSLIYSQGSAGTKAYRKAINKIASAVILS